MSGFLVCMAVLSACPPMVETSTTVASSASTTEQPPVLRSGPELREAVRAALRLWARPSDTEAHVAAKEFLTLYHELERDNRLARAGREQLRGKVRGRLIRLADQIAKRVAREKRLAEKARPEKAELPAGKGDALAQQFGGLGRGGGMFAGGGMQGAGFGGGGLGGRANQDDDHGPELVELIKQTIAPTTWEDVGGNGSIYYWRPGRAVVVRQTDEVHGQIADVLQQLERAGR